MTIPAIFTRDNGAFLRTGMEDEAVFDVSGTGSPLSTIKVHFDDEFTISQPQTMEFQTAQPQASCPESSVPGVSKSSKITIREKVFNVIRIEPTGDGWTTLILSLH